MAGPELGLSISDRKTNEIVPEIALKRGKENCFEHEAES